MEDEPLFTTGTALAAATNWGRRELSELERTERRILAQLSEQQKQDMALALMEAIGTR